MKMTGQSINDVRNSTMVNTQAISKLEMQMGQLANHLGERDKGKLLMQTKEMDMLIIHVGMELNLHKTLCHFLVAQLQDLKPNISRKH